MSKLQNLILLFLTSNAYALSSMHERRDAFAATLLQDGKVLVAGGASGMGNVPEKPLVSHTFEIFDPSAESWELAGSLLEPVTGQNAVTLSHGEVLMVGGETGKRAGAAELRTAQTELYDPHSKTWKKIENAPFAAASRWGSSALIAFGDGLAALIGGHLSYTSAFLNSVSFFSARSLHWTPEDEVELNVARAYQGAIVLRDGRILVVGGMDDQSTLASTEYYDPIKETGDSVGKMHTGRKNPILVELKDGRVLAIGGEGVSEKKNGKRNILLVSVEIFSPKTMKWTTTGSMAFGRFNHTGSLLPDGRVLVVGGDGYANRNRNGKFVALDSVEIYEPKTRNWSSGPPLKMGRSGHHAFTLKDGRVLVVGGHNSAYDALKSVEIYDPQTNRWSSSEEWY